MFVYLIRNVVNGKMYIGKTSGSLKERWGQHIADSKRRSRTYLGRAIIKYGPQAFTIEELERCTNEEDLDRCEAKWIQTYRSDQRDIGYNLTTGGDGGVWTDPKRRESHRLRMLGNSIKRGSSTPEEVRKKIGRGCLGKKYPGRTLSIERRKEISQAMKGRKFTTEHKERISLARKRYLSDVVARRKISIALTGKPKSEEHKLAMSVAARARHARETIERSQQLVAKGQGHVITEEMFRSMA